MPGFLCCFGGPNPTEAAKNPGVAGSKDVLHSPDATTSVPVAVSAKPEQPKEPAPARCSTHGSLPRVPSPPVSANHAVKCLLTGGQPAGGLTQGLLQGIEIQRRIAHLQGHWWTRVEEALDLLARTYSAACASVWIMDDSTESFVALLSKGPMWQAVQPGCSQHTASEYDASPSSLTCLWESKSAQVYSVNHHQRSSNSSSLQNRFPADWKLLYNAHHFTDFLAVPIFASTPIGGTGGGADKTATPVDSLASAAALVSTSGAAAISGAAAVAAAATAGGASNGGGGAGGGSSEAGGGTGSHVIGALTLYLSRPGADRIWELPPSMFSVATEQELVSLAFSSLLFSNGPEPVRQICELVLAVQSAAGSGEIAAAVAAGLQARLRHVLAVSPTALMALVPPRQVSAVVFRDQTAAAVDASGIDSMTVGPSSSQTLPLLHPALASVAGGAGGTGSVTYSGSHSHGGGPRTQCRVAGIHVGNDGGGVGGAIERSPSLLGTGLRGEGAAGTAVATPNNIIGAPVIDAGTGTGGGATGKLLPNSRSMGVLQNHSGLFSCRLDRMQSRYKALVYPLSHTLLQVVLQQRQERKAKARANGGGGGVKQSSSALRELCMSAAAATASGSGAFGGGWIVSDCNEHLHAVHSPSRDVYVMTRVNGRRPHSLVVALAELSGLGGTSDGPAGGVGGGAHTAAAAAGSATHIAVYLAFPDRLPRPLLENALTDTQLLMHKLIAPLIRHRFETSLSEEWTALAAAANNLPSPGGPILRITSSMSASQARHTVPAPLLLSGAAAGALPSDISPGAGGFSASTPPIAESPSATLLTRLGGPMSQHGGMPGLNSNCASPGAFGQVNHGTMGHFGPMGGGTSASELHLEGLSAGEALQQMSVLVASYMDTLQALQGQLMASDRLAESLRREDLPHLQLLEVLGHGGGGVVFRGKLHALEVAVKVFEVPGDLATAAGLSLHHSPNGGKNGEGGGAAAAATAGGAAGNGGGNGGTGGNSSEKQQAAWPAVGDRRVLQRSALELAVTASLSHPHIIQVYSLYTSMVLVKQKPPKQGTSGVQLLELSAATALGSRAEEGIPCSALCMEYCDMGTLAHAIDQHRFLTVTALGARRPALKAICTTLLEVALALRHLHARNLAHCDLKPANVLLKSSRRDSRAFTCKLADFGYVSVLKPSVPGGRPSILPEEACGTVTHMAPETFIKGQPLDFSVDTFSFGILMWELYTCARPYSDVPEDQIAQRVTLKGLRPTFPPDTPRAYGTLARQCWSQDPNERPSSSDIVSAIENMLQIMNTQLPAIPPLKPKSAAASTAAAPTSAAALGTGGAVGAAGVPAGLMSLSVGGKDKSPGRGVMGGGGGAAGVAADRLSLQQQPSPLRMRGSLNGGMPHGGSNLTQSPLGRAPPSPLRHQTAQQPLAPSPVAAGTRGAAAATAVEAATGGKVAAVQ